MPVRCRQYHVQVSSLFKLAVMQPAITKRQKNWTNVGFEITSLENFRGVFFGAGELLKQWHLLSILAKAASQSSSSLPSKPPFPFPFDGDGDAGNDDMTLITYRLTCHTAIIRLLMRCYRSLVAWCSGCPCPCVKFGLVVFLVSF